MLADGEDFQRSFQLKRNVSLVFCTSTSRHEHWMRSAVQSLNWVQWSCQRWFVIFLSSVQWSVLRPTYVRCPTKHTNFMYRQGCIWMKVCQRWCKLDRGPLQAHCAWKRPLASWNMQLPWLDSVSCWLSESAQTLSHHVLMKTNDLRGLPYSEASLQLSLRGTPDTAVWTPDQGSRKFCWGFVDFALPSIV